MLKKEISALQLTGLPVHKRQMKCYDYMEFRKHEIYKAPQLPHMTAAVLLLGENTHTIETGA